MPTQFQSLSSNGHESLTKNFHHKIQNGLFLFPDTNRFFDMNEFNQSYIEYLLPFPLICLALQKRKHPTRKFKVPALINDASIHPMVS